MNKLFLTLGLLLASLGCSAADWVGTWATAPEQAKEANMPAKTKLNNSSLRQTFRVSLGGDEMRIRFSNQFSRMPLEIKSAYVAESTDGSDINASSAKYVEFNGKKSVTIAPGQTVYSDPVKFKVNPLQSVSVTINYGNEVPAAGATTHRGSRATSFIAQGKEVSPKDKFVADETVEHWYTVTSIDVPAKGQKCIAILGNSITDGRGAKTDQNNRWTDAMAEACNGEVGVLNLGIGGNAILSGGLGRPAVERFDEDILGQAGITGVIIGGGVNDIGGSKNAEKTARQLIKQYKAFIDQCRAKGLKVYGATITPFGKSSYYSHFHEAVRQTVNDWIRNEAGYDAVVDFDKAIADPTIPTQMREDFRSDRLHPGPAGYKAMGECAANVVQSTK